MQKLTDRQEKFVQFYDGNATQAAIKSGYSKKTAKLTGHRLITNDNIRQAIQERNKVQDAPVIASRQDRQKFWSAMMNDKTADANVKLKASELLGKSEGDFTEKIQHSGGVTVAMGRIKKGGKELAFKVGKPIRPA